jgi:glycosyltransferase involved in cell wall biosynthesis
MKIAYVSTYNSSDIERWSGSGYFMGKALEKQCGEVIHIGPLRKHRDNVLRAKQVFYTNVMRKRYIEDRASKVLKSYADQVSARLKDARVDVVFSPGTIPICYLESSAPIVFWTDATVAGVIDFYPAWSDLCHESLRDANRMEQAALSNCRLAIYSSDWAAETAINAYQVDADKVKVVPFGANVESVRDLNDIRIIVAQRRTDVCKLLFIGTEWYRKGGDIAVDITGSLNAMGLKTELTVLGCHIKGSVPDFVSPKGFVSKKTSKGRTLIDRLFAESHFLLLPSRADCVPVVIAEANSFGVPVVASDVGGISTAVRDDLNGYVLSSAEQFVPHACSVILKSMESLSAYRELAIRSFGEYTERLNWQTAGRRVHELLENILD